MIHFSKVPKVALEFMNQDHEEATRITNQIMALLEDDSSASADITTALEQLLEHSREHFGREERQMEHYHFPPYPVHKSEHERVLSDITAELVAWRNNNDRERLNHYIFNTLPDWFVTHIATMDTVTAQFIASQGGPLE